MDIQVGDRVTGKWLDETEIKEEIIISKKYLEQINKNIKILSFLHFDLSYNKRRFSFSQS